MSYVFQRERMEPQEDGSVLIGVGIENQAVEANRDGNRPNLTVEWVRCAASHLHGWDICNITGLMNAKPVIGRDKDGKDILGQSRKEVLIEQAERIQARRSVPTEIALPTKRILKVVDGQEVQVDVPDKPISL